MREEKFKITGMSCAACASNITKVVSKVSGVEFVNVNLVSNEMIVRCENKVKNEEIIGAVTSIGYGASLKDKKAIVYYKENVEDSLLIKAIEDAGYKVVKIK